MNNLGGAGGAQHPATRLPVVAAEPASAAAAAALTARLRAAQQAQGIRGDYFLHMRIRSQGMQPVGTGATASVASADDSAGPPTKGVPVFLHHQKAERDKRLFGYCHTTAFLWG